MFCSQEDFADFIEYNLEYVNKIKPHIKDHILIMINELEKNCEKREEYVIQLNSDIYLNILNLLKINKKDFISKGKETFNDFLLNNGNINPNFINFLDSNNFGYMTSRENSLDSECVIYIYGIEKEFYEKINTYTTNIPKNIRFEIRLSHHMVEE